MGRHYKDVKNGRGTDLNIGPGKYISVGPGGTDITVRGNGKVLAFDNWKDFVDAIDQEKSAYHSSDYPGGGKFGECIVNSDGSLMVLRKMYFRQGFVFKDYHAFHNEPKRPCYVPELDDVIYTREDFIILCDGQEDIAEMIFNAVDWQHPGTYLDEQYRDGELYVCKNCGKIFESYDADKCPRCGAAYKKEED